MMRGPADQDALTSEVRKGSEDAVVAAHDLYLEASHRARIEAEIAQVEAALAALAEGQYGRCEDCERPIPAARLIALPGARRCVTCQTAYERARHPHGPETALDDHGEDEEEGE